MDDPTFRIIPVECRLAQLRAIAPSPHSPHASVVTALQIDQPFALQITVEFLGSSAIALLRLSPQIRVDFYAKPATAGTGYELGTVAIATTPSQFTYELEHALESPETLGFVSGGLYRIGAIARIGAPQGPALLSGLTESLMLEIYPGEVANGGGKAESSAKASARRSKKSH